MHFGANFDSCNKNAQEGIDGSHLTCPFPSAYSLFGERSSSLRGRTLARSLPRSLALLLQAVGEFDDGRGSERASVVVGRGEGARAHLHGQFGRSVFPVDMTFSMEDLRQTFDVRAELRRRRRLKMMASTSTLAVGPAESIVYSPNSLRRRRKAFYDWQYEDWPVFFPLEKGISFPPFPRQFAY